MGGVVKSSIEDAHNQQIYLLGVIDDDGNSWEQLLQTSGMGGILRFLGDHQLDLMYAKCITESEAQQWKTQGSGTVG